MDFNPSQIFAQAVTAFQKGQFQQAEKICRDLITKTTPNAICLHLLGVLAHQQGRSVESENWLKQSLILQPDAPEVHYNLGLAYFAQDKLPEALKSFQQALALNPEYAVAYMQSGNVLRKQNHLAEAADAYQQCVKFAPQNSEAWNCLGVVLCEQDKHLGALPCFKQAIEAQPRFAEAYNNLGAAYITLERYEEATKCCRIAIGLNPTYAAAYNNLGNALKSLGEYEQAIAQYEQALAINPHLLETRNNLGLSILYHRFDIADAEACFHQALVQDPNYPQTLNNLGIVSCQKGLFAEGINYYKKALEIQPNYVDALSNLGNALRATRHRDEALDIYREAVLKNPNYAELHNNLAMMLLSTGQFVEGFKEFSWRWKTQQLKSAYRNYSQPLWRGEDLSNKTLFIHAEQGLGDSLQFCRYIPLIKKSNTQIFLEVPPPLARLMAKLSGVDHIITHGDLIPDFDYHCAMMDLPGIFGTQLSTIPRRIPYLSADASDIALWKQRITAPNSVRKIGVTWAGNPRLHTFELAATDRQRSIDPKLLAPLMDIPHVQYYSLQKDGSKAPHAFPILDYMSECHDFADTAAFINQLDLVISVDTSVVHLAGALGKPVWLLNRYDTCWRWLYDRDDSPWYPTLRQFRQTAYGDWSNVIDNVINNLVSFKD